MSEFQFLLCILSFIYIFVLIIQLYNYNYTSHLVNFTCRLITQAILFQYKNKFNTVCVTMLTENIRG